MVKNIEAAKELVELYRNITIEQLKEVYEELCESREDIFFEDILHDITGFGSIASCHLCQPIEGHCSQCIHGEGLATTGASPCTYHETYENIEESGSIHELYNAIQDRADYIESLIKKLENDN